MRSTKRRMSAVLLAVTAASALMLSGCAGGAGNTGALTKDGLVAQLNYGGFGGGDSPKENYNPFLTASRLGAWEYMYEPLMVTNTYSCEAEPWLATAYNWVDPQTLTYTMRDGVKWTDGEDLTADDVAFTFNMLKEFPALDYAGAWKYLDSVTADDAATVTFHFNGPGAAAFSVINDYRIVPEHVWSKQKDPVTFTNAKDPVSSGPFTVKSFTPTTLVIERNPDNWNADAIKVASIKFTNSDGGQVEQLKLARGDYDTQAMFVPNIEKAYVAKDPEHNKYWFPPTVAISMFWNLEKKPFDDVAFRRAIAGAIDKDKIVKDAQFDYTTPASQTNLVLPNRDDLLPEALKGDASFLPFDTAGAADALTAAGYELDSDGKRLGKDGKPIVLSFKVPGGFSDWIATAKIIQSNLSELGIQVDMQNPTPESNDEDRLLGEFDLIFGVRGGGCNIYTAFNDPLNSANTAPTGEKATTNEVRWRDPATDALLDELKTATEEADQARIVGQLAQIMVDQVPFVPIYYGFSSSEFSTKQVTGWPSEEDPYAMPGNNLIVLTHLKPVAKK